MLAQILTRAAARFGSKPALVTDTRTLPDPSTMWRRAMYLGGGGRRDGARAARRGLAHHSHP